MSLQERDVISNPTLLKQSLAVLGLVLVTFASHSVLHYEPSVVALLGAALLVLVSKVAVEDALADIESETLAFFIGLFIMVATAPAGEGDVLWWARAIGADLGGNATAVGASANVVVIGMAARYGSPISFWEFTKYGLVVVAASALVSSAYLWLRYLA